MEKIGVGILGATGMVGQRFVQLLESHPQFVIKALGRFRDIFKIFIKGASQKSAGLRYESACNWKLDTEIPVAIKDMVVQECVPSNFGECRIVFSGLDSSVAGEIEEAFRAAEFAVFSNAKNFRMHVDVPLVVPLVNASHLDIVRHQRSSKGLKKGFIVTNANCSSTGLVVAMKPLHDAFGIKQMHVTTLQAISGAGYPGISALDILGNVVPYIDGEEGKIEVEPLKILGDISADGKTLTNTQILIDATCNRVPVIDGHTECISLKFETPPASIDAVIKCLEEYKSEAQIMNVPSAPETAIVVLRNRDRPQPRLDLMRGKGYTVTIGRLRKGNYWDLNFTLLSHNTILGAAGSSIMNAEISLKKGLL